MAVLTGLYKWLEFELSESRHSVSEISGTSPSAPHGRAHDMAGGGQWRGVESPVGKMGRNDNEKYW